MLNKEELKQRFCVRVPFLLPTSSNHSLDVIVSLTNKTPEQGSGVTPFTSPSSYMRATDSTLTKVIEQQVETEKFYGSYLLLVQTYACDTSVR